MKFWHFKAAFRQFRNRLKHPVTTALSSTWDTHDHQHICLAARLLEHDDFEQVCPCNGKCEIELDDRCDLCPYMTILDFNRDVVYNKWISIHCYDGTKYDPFKDSVDLKDCRVSTNLLLSKLKKEFNRFNK